MFSAKQKKEKDVKIPVESAEDVQPETAEETATSEEVVEEAADQTMTEEEMVEAAIRAGEEAADNDFKVKYENASEELASVRSELEEAVAAKEAAEAKAREAVERAARLQADWENYRRRTARERLEEQERATEKMVMALLPTIDDIERALDHARTQELSEGFQQFVDGVDAVRAKVMGVLEHEGAEVIDPKGEPFDPNIHQAVGRVEDAEQYDETVNDVYQKGYRMAGKVLRPAMVTVTYGGATRPAPEPEEDAEPVSEDAAASGAEDSEE
ncbi:MAG: nucleotide exchange factor GrpE [Coriobacteriaceae bacterium]|nr:nucleotide exchange factor GrpE [Coriobacteriaceae bacterium]